MADTLVIIATESEAEVSGSPSDVEIAVPSFTLVAVFIIGVVIYSCAYTPWWRLRFSRLCKKNKVDTNDKKLVILTTKDKNQLLEIKSFQNNPVAILKLAFPALISMALCPVTLFMFKPTVDFLWPPDRFKAPPDINQAIVCFLMPAGMIYAIAFGFFFEDVIGEFSKLSSEMTKNAAMVRQIATLISTTKGFSSEQKKEVFLSLKNQVFLWLSNITEMRKSDEIVLQDGYVWKIIDTLQSTTNESIQGILDNQVVTEITQKLLRVDTFVTCRVIDGKRKMSVLQWLFLEILGFISFFGVLMIQAKSYKIELTMCIITVFSISIFCYMLADFDCLMHGVFRVDLTPIHNTLIKDLNDLYEKHCDATDIKKTLNLGKLMKPLSKGLCESFSLNKKKMVIGSYN